MLPSWNKDFIICIIIINKKIARTKLTYKKIHDCMHNNICNTISTILKMLGLHLYTLYPYNRSQILQYVKYTK